MAIDLTARQILEQRQKEKREQNLTENLARIAHQLENFEEKFAPMVQVSEASGKSAVMTTALLAYIQQTNQILYTILDQVAKSQDIQTLQNLLIELLQEKKKRKDTKKK